MSDLIQTRNADLPAFIEADDTKLGTELMGEFIRPPRVKVVQALSKALTDQFDAGDTVLLPQRLEIAPVLKNENGKPSHDKSGAGAPWKFVPLFFWPEWVQWNPREVTDEPAIVARTVDRTNPLVAKCRNRDLWSEPHPTKPELNRRNTEHLNFIVMPLEGEIAGTPVVLSFSRSEHRCGSSFASLIKMRKAPLFACVFEASVGYRENTSGEWFGIDVTNPSDGEGFIQDEEAYNTFKDMHLDFVKAHEDQKIQVDLEDETSTEDEEPSF